MKFGTIDHVEKSEVSGFTLPTHTMSWRFQRSRITIMGIWFLVVAVLASDVDLSENVGGQGQSGQAVKLFQAPRQISLTFHF